MDGRYGALFEHRPRTRRFTRMLQAPAAIEQEAQRFLRAREQREIARRKRRGKQGMEVELARGIPSGEGHAQQTRVDDHDLPIVHPRELDSTEQPADPNLDLLLAPPHHLRSPLVETEIEALCHLLRTLDADWHQRTEGMQHLAKLLEDEEFRSKLCVDHVDRIRDPLLLQLTDLRSSLVKDACQSISQCVELAAAAFRPFGGFFVSAALQLVIKTTKVVRDAGHSMATRIIRVLSGEPQILQVICSNLSGGNHPVLREFCAKYLCIILSKPEEDLDKQLVNSSLMSALVDSAAPVRSESKAAFRQYQTTFPRDADLFFQQMDEVLQRRLQSSSEKKPVVRVPISQLRKNAAAAAATACKQPAPFPAVTFAGKQAHSSKPLQEDVPADENSRSSLNTMLIL